MALARPLRIVIPGGTGQVGNILARHFHEQGHSVTVIARHPVETEWPVVAWTGHDLGPWTAAMEGADVVVNLAGRSVNCRYNSTNRREIKNSRIFTTALVGQAIAQAKIPPRLWLNASTATIYRHALDRPMDEATGEIGGNEPGAPEKWAFSIDVATSWERTFFAAETPRTRKIALRSAMTMSPDPGGVFDHLLRLVRWGLGGRSGPGSQYISWIHDVDFIRAIEFLIRREDFQGVVNVASPQPVTNRDFMCCLRRAYCTSYVGLPAPTWALNIGALFMRTETELILKSRRVIPKRLQDAGFEFHFPNWRGACQDLINRWREVTGEEDRPCK
ncbi:MAG TPA: TIGR01777 family oxidoreductase [Bryobacteraceae bacterium]|nr:TIGR01777 family oxidoreductase [Bryobacteraceae bacterium]